MEAYKQEFIDFMVESDVLKFGEFTLKSGRKSPFFMNAGAYVTGSQLKKLGEYYAKAIDVYKRQDEEHQIDIPMTVLVNQYSASASEIFAGAIQDYDLGAIVGTQTYGKGVVQQIFDLKDGTCVKLTIAKYFTAKGQDIDGKGITPDLSLIHIFLKNRKLYRFFLNL